MLANFGTFISAILLTSSFCHAQQQQVVIPATNGTYKVGLTTLQMVNKDSIQPFAPTVQPPLLELSIYYPTDADTLVNVPYMPPETARYEDIEQSTVFGLNSPNGTFEKLVMQLAPNGTNIAKPEAGGKWNLLIQGTGEGTTRYFYSTIAAQVASTGYVVILYDTPYDTDIVQYSDGNIILFNQSLAQNEAEAIQDVDVRAQDASYIITQFSISFSSVIPGCDSCLNTTHVGMFGHSIAGATSATILLNDTRVAGGLNFDGALWGDVVEKGFDRPYMLMVTQGQTAASVNGTADETWDLIWPKLTGPKFDLMLANSEHYTYSDLPLILELLNIVPTNQTVMKKLQITDMNGMRAHHIVTSYATAYFDYLLKGGSSEMLNNTSPAFPEISVDDFGGNATSASGTASPSATASSKSAGVMLNRASWIGIVVVAIGTLSASWV